MVSLRVHSELDDAIVVVVDVQGRGLVYIGSTGIYGIYGICTSRVYDVYRRYRDTR
jgi:hypothetical protein